MLAQAAAATLCFPPARGSAAGGGVPLTVQAPSTRRDKRYVLRQGAGVVEIPQTSARARPVSAPLTKISAAGVAFVLPTPVAGVDAGTPLPDVELRFGSCVLRGDILVRDVRSLDAGGSEVGGMFLPENHEAEARLMALLAGIAAAEPD